MDAVTAQLDAWGLRPDGQTTASDRATVVPVVTDDRQQAVLKLAPADGWHAGSIHAIKAWQKGDGCVELLRAAPARGVVLLERLEERWLDAEDAAAAVARLWRALHRPAPAGLPCLIDLLHPALARVADHGRVPPRLATQALTLVPRLDAGSGPLVAVHGDLGAHHVLWRGEEPRCIAPRGVAADAHAEAIGVFTPASIWGGPIDTVEVQDRFWELSDALAREGLDVVDALLRDWSLVQAVVRADQASDDERATHWITVAKALAGLRVESAD